MFRLETLRRDMARRALHKSAASVNTLKERCDNVSFTLGRRAWCLCHPSRLTRLNSEEHFVYTTGPVWDRGSKVREGERDEYQSVRLMEINTQGSCAGPERVEIDRDL